LTSPIRVLHVDDEPDFADLAAEFLTREDDRFEIETATTAENGIQKLTQSEFDCIVSDYDMPGQNGISFLETVRTDNSELPFILYTGKGSEEVASEAISAGVTDYLQKESGTGQYEILANRVVNAVERHRIEQEAEETRAQLRAIAKHSADAIVVIDPDGLVRFVNPAIEDLLGYPPAELRGSRLTEVMPERLRDRHLDALDRYLDTGERTVDWSNVEFPGRHKDGTEVPLSISYSEFEQDGDRRFIGILRDISERSKMEAELREQHSRLQLFERAVENSTDLLAAVDDKYTLLFANERYQAYHDFSSENFEEATLSELLGDGWESTVKPHVDRALAGEVVRYEMTRSGPDGSERELDISYYPLNDGNGDIIGAVTSMRDITDQTRERRERKKIIARVTDAIVEVDEEWQFTLVNDQAEALYGLSEDDLLGKHFWDVFSEALGTRFESEYRTVMETREPKTFTEYFAGLGGWFDIDVYPDDGGGLSFYFQEVSERISVEENLQLMEQIVREMNDGAVILQDGAIKYANQHVAEVLGCDPDDLVETPLSKVIASEHRHEIVDRHQGRTTETTREPPEIYETVAVTSEGIRVPIEINATEITYDDEPAVLAMVRDITERKEHERELSRQQALLEAQQGAVLDGLLVVDENNEMISYNERFLELWNVPKDVIEKEDEPSALEYATDQLVEPEEFHEKVEYLYENVEETARDEVALTDGRVFDRYTTPLRGDDGTYFGRLWTFRDITDRIETQAELERQNERLEEFARIVSHDLRNPLNVAQGRVEIAQEECESEHLEAAVRAHERTFALIDDLLSLAREGEAVAEMEPVVLANIAQESWQNVDTRDGILDSTTGATIRADRSRVGQLLENLFRNAVEHGGEDVTIRIGDLEDGFFVEDDGPGIPPESRDEVFETGYTTSSAGTGYGLSIVEQIIDSHGWTIQLTNGMDGGARFEISDVVFAE
jgi:PAS domain S-box-containing protein